MHSAAIWEAAVFAVVSDADQFIKKIKYYEKDRHQLQPAALYTGPGSRSKQQGRYRHPAGSFWENKKELVSAYMEVPADQSAAFWQLYDEYEEKRKALGRERLNLIEEYGNNYTTLTDEKAEELAKQSLKNDGQYTRLYETYLKKFSKLTGGKNAAKLFQLETYLQTVVRSAIMENIPFIGELDKSKVTPQ